MEQKTGYLDMCACSVVCMCIVRGGVLCVSVCGVVYVLRVCVGCAFCDLVLRCAVLCRDV